MGGIQVVDFPNRPARAEAVAGNLACLATVDCFITADDCRTRPSTSSINPIGGSRCERRPHRHRRRTAIVLLQPPTVRTHRRHQRMVGAPGRLDRDWRNGQDSNLRALRPAAFKAAAFVHSATVPVTRLAGYTPWLPGEVPERPNGAPC